MTINNDVTGVRTGHTMLSIVIVEWTLSTPERKPAGRECALLRGQRPRAFVTSLGGFVFSRAVLHTNVLSGLVAREQQAML